MMSNTIVLAEVVDVVWMIWFVIAAMRAHGSAQRLLTDQGLTRSATV